MYKRKDRKRKRKRQLLIGMFMCVAMTCIAGVKFAVLLHAEKGTEPRKKNEVIKIEGDVKDMEYLKNVECILQNPELPTGCEATAATILLNAYGYPVDKMTVADCFEKSKKVEKNGKIYGCHPDDTFIGEPYVLQGYGAFPKVVVKAMQKIIDKQDGIYEACALYGKTEEELLTFIDEGKPVCVWSSMDNREIEYRRGWYLIKEGKFTDEYFYWPSNEHVVVLIGYNEKIVTVCDPLKGICEYPRESFFRHYEQVGKYAVMMMRK